MKVYAVEKTDTGLVLREWESKAAFQSDNSWIDPKFVRVVTSGDLQDDHYDFPLGTGFIVYTDDQIKAHDMLREVR